MKYKWLKSLKEFFIKPASLQDGLEAIKSQFGKVGEIVYQKPGLRYYRIEGTDDLLEIGIKELHPTSTINLRTFGARRLVPSDITYSAYQRKIGEMGSISTSRHADETNKCFATIIGIPQERLANKFAPGGLSKEVVINNKSYFVPANSCLGKGGYAIRTYPS